LDDPSSWMPERSVINVLHPKPQDDYGAPAKILSPIGDSGSAIGI
jgi:hypothetical protein